MQFRHLTRDDPGSDMETLDINTTNGSNLTGPSATGLITFTAVSWVYPVFAFGIFCIEWASKLRFSLVTRRQTSTKSTFVRIFTGLTVIGMIAGLVILVTGSVLSAQNGDSTNTPVLNAEGLTGRVLLIFSAVISLLVVVVLTAAVACELHGRKATCAATVGFMPGVLPGILSVIGVAILAQSSFELDAVQITNGSNSTIIVSPVQSTTQTAGETLCGLGTGLLVFFHFIAFIVVIVHNRKFDESKVRNKAQVTKEIKARLRMSKSLLEEALKHGFVECRTVVCLLVGVAGAGKTHTKHLLFRWDPPECRHSTPIAVRPVRAVRVSTQSGKLQEVDPDQLDEMLAATVATGVPLEKMTSVQSLCCICFDKNQTTSAGISPPFDENRQSHSNTESSPGESNKPSWCCCCPIADLPDSQLQEITKLALHQTTRLVSASSGSKQRLSTDWIYLIDSGGQVEFLEVLPAFLQNTSVCLFITKLSEVLCERPQIKYFKDGKLVGELPLCPFTNEEMLMRCVQTFQSQCIHQDDNTNKGSRLVMVGTHQDLENHCSESREEKNQRLAALLHKFETSLVFRGQDMTELIFPVNAKTPGPQDHEVASEIAKVILNAASGVEPRKTPISWFKFEQFVQKLASSGHGRKILHREECFQIAQVFHLSEQDFDAALDHLASFGVIHYYPHLLPDVVFIDPQYLLDRISELVRYHYKLRHEADPHTATGGELGKFRNEGCITVKFPIMEKFSQHYTSFFTPADFLELMKDRLVIAQLMGKDEYFMPCLLRTMESKEIDEYRVASSASRVAPLAIHFSCGYVPHGVFCSLVTYLRSQNNSSWRLSPSSESNTVPLCLTRNCIKFQFPEGAPGSLTLIDAFSHFEIHVNAPHDVCDSLCPSIRLTLYEGIQKAAETLKYYQLVPKQAFLCKHGSDCYTQHLALPADALNYWKCELNPDSVFGPLTDEHKVWLPKKGVQAPTTQVQAIVEGQSVVEEGCPTVLECIKFQGKERTINIPQEIGVNYSQFGIFILDDPNGTRAHNMEYEYRGNAERINTEILREWAAGRGKQPVSWEILTEVLRDIELGTLASEIEEVKLSQAASF